MAYLWGVSPTPTPPRFNNPGSLYVTSCHLMSWQVGHRGHHGTSWDMSGRGQGGHGWQSRTCVYMLGDVCTCKDIWPSYRHYDEKGAHMSADMLGWGRDYVLRQPKDLVAQGYHHQAIGTQCHPDGIRCHCTKLCTMRTRGYIERARTHALGWIVCSKRRLDHGLT